MKIFLPPSEGKTPATAGSELDLAALSFPELTELRAELIDVLQDVSAREDALDILGVGARVADDVARQIDLWGQPCAPAHEIYTGVLFAALDFSGLTEIQQNIAHERVVIFSGLFGALRPLDEIPAYRLSMGTKLRAENTATRWRAEMKKLEVGSGELIIDCRSGNYRVYNPPGSQVVTIRAVRERNDVRSVVSHNAKHYRGLLAGALLRSGDDFDDPEQLAEFAHVLIEGGHIDAVELEMSAKEWQLTLVERGR